MRKLLVILFGGIILLGCQKDDDNNSSNSTSGTAHSCGAKDVHNPNLTYGSVNDIDGNTYKTIQIGTQTWMAENLKTTKYRNGVSIPNITDNNEWMKDLTGAYCSINNNSSNDCPYGKLYNWYAVNNANNICPIGWHVPTITEWNTLVKYLDPLADTSCNNLYACRPSKTVGSKLKSMDSQYWILPNRDATNISGFSGLPAGSRGDYEGDFDILGYACSYWSSSDTIKGDGRGAWHINFGVTDTFEISYGATPGELNKSAWFKQYGFSVRCIKD